MVKNLKIGIAGAGIGGLCTGAFLARQGHGVTLFDQFEKPEPVGSGLVIQPVGLAVLARLGIGDAVREMGAPLSQLTGHEAKSARQVLNAGYGRVRGLGIHRASLFEALLTAAKKAGCVIKTGAEISGSTMTANGRVLDFENGGTSEDFDLVVDGTGAGSPLSPMKRKDLPFGALWGTVDWPHKSDLPLDHLTQKYRRSSRMIGVLPIGGMPGSDGQKAAIFWSLRDDQYAAWRGAALKDWKSEALAIWPEFAPFLDQITRHDQMTMAQYGHGTLRKPLSERMVHIGDAAHSTSPQLGQGANMALLDALALAEALRERPLDQALENYAQARRLHVRVYQALSRMFTPAYQSDSLLVPVVRDWILAPASFVPPVPWILSRLVSGNFVAPVKGVRLELGGPDAPL